MFGLDDWVAGYSDGVTLWLVVVVAILLGLRHAKAPPCGCTPEADEPAL